MHGTIGHYRRRQYTNILYEVQSIATYKLVKRDCEHTLSIEYLLLIMPSLYAFKLSTITGAGVTSDVPPTFQLSKQLRAAERQSRLLPFNCMQLRDYACSYKRPCIFPVKSIVKSTSMLKHLRCEKRPCYSGSLTHITGLQALISHAVS